MCGDHVSICRPNPPLVTVAHDSNNYSKKYLYFPICPWVRIGMKDAGLRQTVFVLFAHRKIARYLSQPACNFPCNRAAGCSAIVWRWWSRVRSVSPILSLSLWKYKHTDCLHCMRAIMFKMFWIVYYMCLYMRRSIWDRSSFESDLALLIHSRYRAILARATSPHNVLRYSNRATSPHNVLRYSNRLAPWRRRTQCCRNVALRKSAMLPQCCPKGFSRARIRLSSTRSPLFNCATSSHVQALQIYPG